MATRYIRDTTILAKIETTSGTDSVPTGAANSIQVSNVKIEALNTTYVDRELLRAYFGSNDQLVASVNKKVSFDVELVGSGTAGTAPAWGPLLRACGFAQTLVATERVNYIPITNGQESVSIYVFDPGVRHVLLYAKGSVKFDMTLNKIPKMMFEFIGLDGSDTAANPTGVTYAAFLQPQVVQDAFTGDLTLGGTLSGTGVPAITGGTVYPSMGLEVDAGITAEHIDLLGGQSIDITDRKMRGKIMVDSSAAEEVAFLAGIKAGTLQSLGLIHGTVVGRRAGLFAPIAQLIMPEKGDYKGKRLGGYDVVLQPGAGNLDLTVVTSF